MLTRKGQKIALGGEALPPKLLPEATKALLVGTVAEHIKPE